MSSISSFSCFDLFGSRGFLLNCRFLMPQAMNHGGLTGPTWQTLPGPPKDSGCQSSIFTPPHFFKKKSVSLYCDFGCSDECAMIMNALRQRLGNTGANWRHVYKVSFLERNDNVS